MRMPRLLSLALTACCAALALGCPGARAENLPPSPDRLSAAPEPGMSSSFGTNDGNTVRSVTVGQLENLAAQKLNQDLITKLIGPLPGWLQRVEVTGNFNLSNWRGLEVLTVQPLWQNTAHTSVLFTQLSAVNYRMFDRERFAANAGLGYRQLLLDNQLMVGGNIFYDHEFLRGHHRMGAGAEVKYGPLDFTANGYLGLNQRSASDGTVERVPNGVDVELGTQIPYLPWAKLYGKYYAWDHKLDSEPVRGAQLSTEASLHRYLSVEGGARHDIGGHNEGFFMLRVKLNRDTMPGLFDGAPLIDKHIFAPRDLSKQLLAKVRRENRIILERSRPFGGQNGVTVSVSRRN